MQRPTRQPISMSTSPSQPMFQPQAYLPHMVPGGGVYLMQGGQPMPGQAPPPMQVPQHQYGQRMQNPYGMPAQSGQMTMPGTQPSYYQQPAAGIYTQYPMTPGVPQPRPTMAPPQPQASQSYQRRPKNIIRIMDPNTNRDVTEEIMGAQAGQMATSPPLSTTPSSSSARTTPMGATPPPAQGNDIAAQFAAQVAATLNTNRMGGSEQQFNTQPASGAPGAPQPNMDMSSQVAGQHPQPPFQNNHESAESEISQHTHVHNHTHSSPPPLIEATEPARGAPPGEHTRHPAVIEHAHEHMTIRALSEPPIPASRATPESDNTHSVARETQDSLKADIIPTHTQESVSVPVDAVPEATTEPSIKQQSPAPQLSQRQDSVEKVIKPAENKPVSVPLPQRTTNDGAPRTNNNQAGHLPKDNKVAAPLEKPRGKSNKNNKKKKKAFNTKEKDGSDMDAFTTEDSTVSTLENADGMVPEVNGIAASPVNEESPTPMDDGAASTPDIAIAAAAAIAAPESPVLSPVENTSINPMKQVSREAFVKPTPEPLIKQVTPEPIIKQSIPEPAVKQVTPEPIVKNDTPEPTVKEASPEPVTKQTTPEPMAKQTAPEPITKEVTPEPLIKQDSSEAVVERTSQKNSPERTVNSESHVDTLVSSVEALHINSTAKSDNHQSLDISTHPHSDNTDSRITPPISEQTTITDVQNTQKSNLVNDRRTASSPVVTTDITPVVADSSDSALNNVVQDTTSSPALANDITAPSAIKIEDDSLSTNVQQNDVSSEKTLTREKSPSDTSVITKPSKPAGPQLTYKDDQWAPTNTAGKKAYDRSFLLQLQYINDSINKPKGLPVLDCILNEPIMNQPFQNDANFVAPRPPGNVPDFTPGFMKPAMRGIPGGDRRMGGGGSMQGGRSRSQQKDRRDDPRGGPMRGPPGQKVISITLQQDIKLQRTDNAWKPGVTDQKDPKKDKDGNVVKDTDAETAEVLKKVRAILNKLTPQKFNTLLEKIRALEINTLERLTGAIDLTFEKAIDEPNFSVAYARLCKKLSDIKVTTVNDKGAEVPCNFNKLLINRCQKEFQKDYTHDIPYDKHKKAMAEAKTADEKKMAQAALDADELKARRRSTGNIKFIGELFKLNMLTAPIISSCIQKLMVIEEESLECLCKLLTTVGKDFDQPKNKVQVDSYFGQLEKFTSNKKVPSRVRFLIQDVIDLRKNNWVPRRDDSNPKTIEQIHKEAQQEDVKNAMMAEQFHQQQQQNMSRSGSNQRGPSGRRPGQPPAGFGTPGHDDSGWQNVAGKGSRNLNLNAMDPTKMKLTSRQEVSDNIQLGPGGLGGPRGFGNWGRGASGGTGSKSASIEGERPPTPGSGNRFAALNQQNRGGESFDNRLGPGGRRTSTPGKFPLGPRGNMSSDRQAAVNLARNLAGNRPSSSPMSSRGNSRENSRNRGTASREGSIDRRGGSSTPRESATPTPPPTKPEISDELMEKKSKAIIEEYLGINDLKEGTTCVRELGSPSNMHLFVYTAAIDVLETNADKRGRCGYFLYEILAQKIFTIDVYIKGMAELLQFAEDMAIDLPKIWSCLGELIGPLIQESGLVEMIHLKQILSPLQSCGRAGTVAAECLKNAVSRLGVANVTDQWAAAALQWTDFVQPSDSTWPSVLDFVKTHKLEFTLEGSNTPMSYERLRKEVERQINENTPNDPIAKFVMENIDEQRRSEPAFIRAFMQSIYASSLSECKTQMSSEKIKDRAILCIKFLDHKTDLELQALYTLQALVHQLQHPNGLLKNFFDCLYDEDIISEDSFYQWNNIDDPAELQGKGVAKTSVQQFFTWLKTEDEEEEMT